MPTNRLNGPNFGMKVSTPNFLVPKRRANRGIMSMLDQHPGVLIRQGGKSRSTSFLNLYVKSGDPMGAGTYRIGRAPTLD